MPENKAEQGLRHVHFSITAPAVCRHRAAPDVINARNRRKNCCLAEKSTADGGYSAAPRRRPVTLPVPGRSFVPPRQPSNSPKSSNSKNLLTKYWVWI